MDVHPNLMPLPLEDTWTEVANLQAPASAEDLAPLIEQYPDLQVVPRQFGTGSRLVAGHDVQTLCDCGEPGVFSVRSPLQNYGTPACLEHVGAVLLNSGRSTGSHAHREAAVWWSIPPLPEIPDQPTDLGLTTNVCPS